MAEQISSVRLYILFALVLSLSCTITYAQEEEDIPIAPKQKESDIVTVANRFKPRPKFFELNVLSFDDFLVETESELEGDENATVSQNLIREAKLKFPIILKERVNLIGGFGYRHEQFKFSDQSDPTYPLFQRFDDRSLKRYSFSLYYKRELSTSRFLFMFFNGSLNSDDPGFNNFGDQLKSSITTLFGKQISLHKQRGFGISFGYDFGQPAIFPVYMLNNDFALKWGYELLLPKSAKLRYSPSESDHISTTIEVQGASYHLQDTLLESFESLEFRRSAVAWNLTYEREIHDWIWAGATVGYRVPINIFISEPRERRRDALLLIDAHNALYFQFSIFLVPPKNLFKKAKGSG